jgi:protein-disulfide isomerase
MNENNLTSQEDPDTITFKRSHFYSVLVVLSFGLGILAGYFIWGRGSATQYAVLPQAPQATAGPLVEVPTPDTQYVRYDIPTEGYPSIGPADAPITIVEFSDFQCPFCRRFHEDTYQALLSAYPGKIRFVYRNLPLTSIHPESFPSAVASQCAVEQNSDVFWSYHDKLFSSDNLGRDVYIQYADELGLDTEKFASCLDSDTHDEYINTDMDFALKMGVNSTPTFFVNGLAIVGAQPLSAFQQVIDKELAGEIPNK